MKFKPLMLALAGLGVVACSTPSVNPENARSLDFTGQKYADKTLQVDGQTLRYRAFENIVYVRNPVDADYETINIYIPEAYFNGGSINGYTAETAPIFFPNQIGGYMPAKAGVPGEGRRGARQPGQLDAMQQALARGLVVASSGARGRTAANGKAPAAIVDLKAAVRYLKYNDKAMPGDANKIISNGTSAGGALSVLLGATGRRADYEPYLKALGAAEAGDELFAVSAYCPISILEHADAAYEWQFNGIDAYQRVDRSQVDYHAERKLIKGALTPRQKQFSNQLKPQFAHYVNSLKLTDKSGKALTLDAKGNGSFKRHVASYLAASAQKELDAGKDLGKRDWLRIRKGKVVSVDFAGYVKAAGRMKTPPAFDGVDLSTAENQLFGSQSVDKRHFTDFSYRNSTVKGASRADEERVRLMNPMHYIGRDTAPQHWRIRVGTADLDTSHAIAVILATRLENSGKRVDFFMPWDVSHGGDYDLDELFAWIDQVAKAP